MIFYYSMNYENVKENEEKRIEEAHRDRLPARPRTNSDMRMGAFFSILLTIMVWCLCFYRARRFYQLLTEAEEEAEERLQTELNMVESSRLADADDNDNNSGGGSNGPDEEMGVDETRPRPPIMIV